MAASRVHIFASPSRPHPPERASRVLEHAAGLVGATAVVGFAVPYLGSSVLDRHHDLYLAIYFASVLPLCAAYVNSTGLDLRTTTLTRHWKLNSLLGLVFGIALVRNVFSEDAAPRPDGAHFIFELIWRGGIYGAIDALLLTVLSCLIVYRSLGGRLATWRRRLAYFGASPALVMTITAVYHLGYSQSPRRRDRRSRDRQHDHLDADAPHHEPHRVGRRSRCDAHLRGGPQLRDGGAPASADQGALTGGPEWPHVLLLIPRTRPMLRLRPR